MQRDQSEAILGKKIEVKRIQPLLKIRNPISSGIKKGKDCKNGPNGLEHLECFNLYSIKLGLIRDLISLSSKYQSDYSMRARFSKILKLSQSLDSLLQISAERIRMDTKIRDGIVESWKMMENVKIDEKVTNEVEILDDDSIKICTNISGVYCICFVTFNSKFTQFDISVYSRNDIDYHSYHLSQKVPVDKKFDDLNINFLILNKLYFGMHIDRIVLRYRNQPGKEESIVVSVQGILNKCCVLIKEEDSEYRLETLNSFLNIPKNELKIQSIEEIRDPGKRSLIRFELEQNLSYINGDLCWKMSQYLINKSLNRKTCTNIVKKQFFDRRDKLDQYEEVALSETLMIRNTNAKVDLIFNNFLQKNRILLTLGQMSIKITEEEYKKEFKSMKKLQNTNFCSYTMVKSLEFISFLNKILFE